MENKTLIMDIQEQSRTKNSIRNTFWGLIYKAIAIILPFATRTIIIKYLGMEYLGVNSLFTSILSVLSLTELGFNTAILYSMYKTVANKDIEKSNALLNFYKKVYRVVALIILLVGSLVCIKIDWFIAGDVPSGLNIYVVYAFFLLSSVSSYSFFAYAAILFSANQREDISYRIHIIVFALRELTQIILLIIFRNYYIYVAIILFANIVNNLLSYFVVRKKFPVFRATGKLDSSDKKQLRKSVGGLMIGKLSVVSRNSFDSIVISSFLGLVAAAIYSNYYYIMISVFGLIYYFCSGLRTSIGNKIATDTPQNNYKDMMDFTFGFFVISCICSSIMICLFQPFMCLWVGERFVSSLALPILMVVYFYFYCSTGIISQYWEGAGLFWENRIRYIVEAISNLVLDVVLVMFFKLPGVILATIITMFFYTNIWGSVIIFKHYFKKCSLKKYFLNQFLYAVIAFFVCLLSFLICQFVTSNGVLGLVYKAFISLLIPCIILPLTFSKTAEFKNLFAKLKILIPNYFRISANSFIIVLYSILLIGFIAIKILVFYL